MTLHPRLFVLLLCLSMANLASAKDADKAVQDGNSVKEKELKLEDLMPEKSVFGQCVVHGFL